MFSKSHHFDQTIKWLKIKTEKKNIKTANDVQSSQTQ
jgi:hypothetical protein